LQDLLKTSALQVLDKGGVVRGFENWGSRILPHRIKRHQQYFNSGQYVVVVIYELVIQLSMAITNVLVTFFSTIFSYWLMHFDANPTTVQELGKKLRVDPRVLRHNVIKLGSKLEDVTARPEKTF
jgi:small subunit ribosomal protein S6